MRSEGGVDQGGTPALVTIPAATAATAASISTAASVRADSASASARG